jgi:aminomethyltransferase
MLQPLTDVDILNMKYYTFVKGKFAGVDNVLISATGYTGSGGIEIYFEDKDDNANIIWDKIFAEGTPKGLKPIGLAARDTLRIEMGYCLYGNDIDDTTTPLEAGLGWITKFAKDFVAHDILAKEKADGIKQKLIGLEMLGKGIPRHDYEIVNEEGEKIGRVTSGTQSPSLQKAIAMGYVNVSYSKIDTKLFIKIREKLAPAKVVKMPFE